MCRRTSKYMLLFVVFCICQVSGSPFFYWSEPDCNQQNTVYSYNDGPSYQETMRDMFDETIKAICDIVRVTARAAKQELSEIAKIIYRHYQNTACSEEPAGGYPGTSVGEIYITTDTAETDVPTTPGDSLIEDKFGNADNSSTTTETSPSTTELPTTDKGERSSLQTTSSSSGSWKPLEGIDLTTLTITTGHPDYETSTLPEGTTESSFTTETAGYQ